MNFVFLLHSPFVKLTFSPPCNSVIFFADIHPGNFMVTADKIYIVDLEATNFQVQISMLESKAVKRK